MELGDGLRLQNGRQVPDIARQYQWLDVGNSTQGQREELGAEADVERSPF